MLGFSCALSKTQVAEIREKVRPYVESILMPEHVNALDQIGITEDMLTLRLAETSENTSADPLKILASYKPVSERLGYVVN